TTLFTAFIEREPSGPAVVATVKACELASCASTLRMLYRQSFPRDGVVTLDPLAVDGTEFFFESPDSLGATYIVACPRTGCITAPRQVALGNGRYLAAVEG